MILKYIIDKLYNAYKSINNVVVVKTRSAYNKRKKFLQQAKSIGYLGSNTFY